MKIEKQDTETREFSTFSPYFILLTEFFCQATLMSVTIESDLKEVLNKIGQRLKRIDERFNKLEIGQARSEEKWMGWLSALSINLSVEVF